jgi:DNA polymerase III epsilon subunit-like protein
MRILFFDTETTGLPDRFAGPQSPYQPHLVQLGAILADGEGNESGELINAIVRPDGWHIPMEASRIHGITTELALQQGMALNDVLRGFTDLASDANVIVAHNLDFDLLVMMAAYHRAGTAHPFQNKHACCTMKSATSICKLPGPYGYKWPTLSEAYRHLVGKTFSDAHNALADVRACKEVYYSLCKLGIACPHEL